jgi:putative copper resistance protein D
VSAPGIPRLLVGSWEPSLTVLLAAAAAVALYALAARRTRGWPFARTASFAAGVGVAVIALCSGLARYDERLLSAHMVQHLLLLLAAPLLLLAGRPGALALRALSPGSRSRLARIMRRGESVARPAVCLAVFYLVVIGTQVPALFDAAARHDGLHGLEHGLYLTAGMLYLWPLVGATSARRRLGGMASFVYVLAAMPACALVGAYLNRADSVVYPLYRAPSHALGVSPLTDQAQAGAIMWVGAHAFLIGLALWLLMARLSAEERRQQLRETRGAVQ